MAAVLTKKNKIELTSYDYESDIQNRLLMASLGPVEVRVLEEILSSSIRFSLKHLSSYTDLSVAELEPILAKFIDAGLVKKEGADLVVDKDLRRQFDFLIQKFDPDFDCGMELLQGLLRKVPIHVLPNWYAIPRTSNNIFESLIDKYLRFPQMFVRYMLELTFDEPVLDALFQDVYSSDAFEIPAAALRAKYDLTPEFYQECVLMLEFSLVCCSSYREENGVLVEYLAPFAEWKEYALTRKNNLPNAVAGLKATSKASFAHLDVLAKALAQPEKASKEHLAKLASMRFISEGKATAAGKHWLTLGAEDRAIYLYRHPLNRPSGFDVSLLHGQEGAFERYVREVERALSGLGKGSWISFADLMRWIIAPIGAQEPVSLKKQGRKWRYQLPEYSSKEQNFIHSIIFERLAELGMVDTARTEAGDFFCITDFGYESLGFEESH